MHMSNMRDNERLSLLKEIGGTGVYEERRRESLKVMADTETRRSQIEETVRLRGSGEAERLGGLLMLWIGDGAGSRGAGSAVGRYTDDCTHTSLSPTAISPSPSPFFVLLDPCSLACLPPFPPPLHLTVCANSCRWA